MTKAEMEKYTTLDTDQCKWWVNHLFNIAKETAFNANAMDDAKEIQSAQDKIIKLLEQNPCEDAVSRKAVADIINRQRFGIDKISWDIIKRKLESLPPVIPTREHGEWTDEVIEKQGNKLIECMTTEAYKIAKGNIDKARKIIAGKISEEEEKQLIFGADMRKEQK